MDRKAAFAGLFYPDTAQQCQKMFTQFAVEIDDVEVSGQLNLGIAPHAGWTFSGKTAYSVFQALRKQNLQIKTFIILGAIHVGGVFTPSTWGSGHWQTPLGRIAVNVSLTEKLIHSELVEIDTKAHLREHSIEVLLPFIQHFFPHSDFVPIMIPVMSSANQFGAELAKIVHQDSPSTAVICSTDLTHYGSRFHFTPQGTGHQSLQWVKNNNDKRIIDLMLQLQDAKIVEEVEKNHNACGAGAIAATLAFARVKGKHRGQLLHYTTSWDVDPQPDVDNFVGYTGIVI